MSILTTLLLTLPLATPVEQAEVPEIQPPPLELAMLYRNWLGAMQAEEFPRAAEMVLEDDLRDLQERTVGQLQRQRPDKPLFRRLFNLGVNSIEELEGLSPQEFFTSAMLAGGSPVSGFLRATTVEVLDGKVEGDRGWLTIEMTVSAQGGDVTRTREIRQEFRRIEGKWFISLSSGFLGQALAPPAEPAAQPTPGK